MQLSFSSRVTAVGWYVQIISTNIAEASITIADVAIVIDSGKVKEKYYATFHGISALREVWISKSSAEQRKGR